MLYRLAEGERQRRPRPIQRPQCNSSRMPSIPMCCVKVEPTLNYGWTVLFVWATLNTRRQSLERSVPCAPQFLCLSVWIAVVIKVWLKCQSLISPLTPAVSSLMNMMCISYLNPDQNPASYCVKFTCRNLVGERLQSKGHIVSGSLFPLVENNSSASYCGRFYQNSPAKSPRPVTSPQNSSLCQVNSVITGVSWECVKGCQISVLHHL